MRTFFYATVIRQSSEQLCLPSLSVKYQNVEFPQKCPRWVLISTLSQTADWQSTWTWKFPFLPRQWLCSAACSCCCLRAALAEELQQAGVGFQNSSSIRLPEPILWCFRTWATSWETGIQMAWKENLAALKSSLFFSSRARISLLAAAKLLFVWNCFPTEECWFGVGGGCFSWNCFCNLAKPYRIHLKQTTSTFNFQRQLKIFPCLMTRKWGFFFSKKNKK